MKPYQRILCPIDYSPYSAEALKHTLTISEAFHAKAVVLHVFNLPGFVTGTGVNGEMLSLAEHDLKEFTSRHGASHLEIAIEVIMGNVGDTIIEKANGLNTDLIVIGSHGHSGAHMLFLGSTTEHILEYSKIPTLIIRL